MKTKHHKLTLCPIFFLLVLLYSIVICVDYIIINSKRKQHVTFSVFTAKNNLISDFPGLQNIPSEPDIEKDGMSHQRSVLEHMQSRRIWENSLECVPDMDRPVRTNHCLWSSAIDMDFCPVACPRTGFLNCPDLNIVSSMENDKTCVRGDAKQVCISVDSTADVYAQYFSWQEVDFMTKRHIPVSERTMGFLASFVSNCVAWRTDYLQELNKALNLHRVPMNHNYGGCLHDTDPPAGVTISDKYGIKNYLAQRHRYVFAFENSERNGYVTEKLFYLLSCGAVPVYRGAPNVRKYLPTTEAAVIVSSTETPTELAHRLLMENDTQYAKRLTWRTGEQLPDLAWVSRMDLSVWHSQCRACVRIASMESLPKTTGLWVRERGWFEYTEIILEKHHSFLKVCLFVVDALKLNDMDMKPRGGQAVVEMYRTWDRNKCPITTMDALQKLPPGTELEVVLENPGWKRRASFATYSYNVNPVS